MIRAKSVITLTAQPLSGFPFLEYGLVGSRTQVNHFARQPNHYDNDYWKALCGKSSELEKNQSKKKKQKSKLLMLLVCLYI